MKQGKKVLSKFKIFALVVTLALILVGGSLFGFLISSKNAPKTQIVTETPIIEDTTPTSVWSGGTAAFTHGTGTENDPYLVESAENLAYISVNFDQANVKGKFFRQTVDIDLQSRTWTPVNPTSYQAGFTYRYDGANHKIYNLNINYTTGYAGLFGSMYGNGYIKNLSIESGTISGNMSNSYQTGAFVGIMLESFVDNCVTKSGVTVTGSYAGGICGGIQGNSAQSCYISNSVNNARVDGKTTGSGICPAGWGKFENCTNNAYITGTNMASGIAGSMDSYVYACVNTGKIEAKSTDNNYTGGYAGGIIAATWNRGCAVNCVNSGDVVAMGSTSRSGGIWGTCGASNSTTKYYDILNSFNTGNVTGGNQVGGILGSSVSSTHITISNCHNSGDITIDGTGENNGGIVGLCNGSQMLITDCYNTGDVTSNKNCVGGIVGHAPGGANLTIKNCYNTGDISSTAQLVGGICGRLYAATMFLLIIAKIMD